MTGLKLLPKWQGKAYRGYTGYKNTGKTAFDVIEFESVTLGNYKDFRHLTIEMLNELHTYPAENLIWVTTSKQRASHYGEVFRVFMYGTERIIATDGDDGYLILKMKER